MPVPCSADQTFPGGGEPGVPSVPTGDETNASTAAKTKMAAPAQSAILAKPLLVLDFPPQQSLYFLPLPHEQGVFRPAFMLTPL